MSRAEVLRVPDARTPVELRIALVGLKVLAVLALPAIGLAWLAAGPAGAVGAAVAVAVIAGMALLSAGSLSLAAPFGPTALMAVALGGYALRLGIYALLIVLLRPLEAIHGPSLAVSAAVLVLATLAAEARAVLRAPQYFWIDASAAAATTQTRSTAA